jgi:hypothetical protein
MEKTMSTLEKIEKEWDQLFTQYKNQTGGSVVCMVNKRTKKRIYLDIQSNRILSKREAALYSIDLTGRFMLNP